MRINEIEEAFDGPEFPDKKFDKKYMDSQMYDSTKLVDVSNSLSLWQKNEFFILKKDQETTIGFVKLSDSTINNTLYSHVDLLYIFPAFRNTSAIKWLIYAVKEYAQNPVIADGAIFKGGQQLIKSMMSLGMCRVSALNTITGEKQEITKPINDPDLCYVFESTRLGFGKNYFNEDATYRGNGWSWYPLFEEI